MAVSDLLVYQRSHAKLTDPVAAERVARLVAPALGRLNAKKAATSTKVTAQEVDDHARHRTTARAS